MMKSLLPSVFLLTFVLCGVRAQTSVTKEINTGTFDRIRVSSAIDVTVRQGDFNVVVDLPPGETKYLRLSTENNTLVVRLERPAGDWLSSGQRRSPRLTITMPSLRGITLSGASDGNVSGFTNVQNLDIQLSGASDLVMRNIEAEKISLKASGASDTRLEGRTRRLEAEISGSSDLSAFGLTADEAIIRAQGASDANVTVRRRIEKYARGGSDITVRGNPETVISKKLED